MKYEFNSLEKVIKETLEEFYSNRNNDSATIEWCVNKDLEKIADFLINESLNIKGK